MGLFQLFSKKSPEAEMGFWDHLDVLRGTLVRSVIVIGIFTVLAFVYKDFLYNTVILGPKEPDFITNRALNWLGHTLNINSILVQSVDFKLVNLDLSGQFLNHMLISFVTGIICAMPYLLTELWWFIKPALTVEERKGARGFILVSNILFISGIAFGYFVIAPLSLSFLYSYTLSPDIVNTITLDSYLKNVIVVSLAGGIVFQLPVVMFFLARLGIVTKSLLRKYRKHAAIVLFIIAAVITPSPDVFSMTLVALPLLLLYEVSIVVTGRVEKRKLKNLARES